ncbi:hypothetical protein [Novosphingopyxis sp.]|uniref:hypothetical protein n=1 Tax=Novosphingopyxis sp. TaxID=2709690 RepID=UPI003B59CF88
MPDRVMVDIIDMRGEVVVRYDCSCDGAFCQGSMHYIEYGEKAPIFAQEKGDYVPCKPVSFFRHPSESWGLGRIAMRPEMPAFRVPTKYYFVGCPFAGMTYKERRSYAVSEFPSDWVCKVHNRQEKGPPDRSDGPSLFSLG